MTQFTAVGVCASAYTLAVIAIERYYAICRPLESRKWQTKKRALITISLVWCFSFSANLTSLFLYDTVPIGNKFTCDSTKGPLVDFIYQLYLTFTLLFVPLALMVGLYGNVIITLNTAINSDNPTVEQQMIEKTLPSRASFSDWFVSAVQRVPSMKVVSSTFQFKEKNSLSIPQTTGLSTTRPSSRSSFSSFFSTPRGSFDATMLLRSTNQEKILIAKRKVTRMLITLVIVFAFCWVPSYMYWLLLRMADLAETSLWNPGLNSSLTILTYISSLANPITYCFMNKSFRSSVLAYCRRKPKRALIDLVLDSSVHI
uniref:G_PROTEIN_RECEP_F1_2 domain-containing protein n=1 Tax=Caenorhabditis japonica TaxID=281687 RepID=A0A8R1EFF9_CAEJA